VTINIYAAGSLNRTTLQAETPSNTRLRSGGEGGLGLKWFMAKEKLSNSGCFAKKKDLHF